MSRNILFAFAHVYNYRLLVGPARLYKVVKMFSVISQFCAVLVTTPAGTTQLQDMDGAKEGKRNIFRNLIS